MNRSICNLYSAARPGASQGELRHRYVLGLYDLLDHVKERYPRLLVEGCSGGGGRVDAGILFYSPQIWCSDKTDPIDRVRIQTGTSLIYPVSSISAHVSQSPNHQTQRETPITARCYCAMQGAYGFEVDPSVLSAEEKAFLSKETAFYKENQELIRNGAFYRLHSDELYSAWSFVSEDRKKALMILAFTAEEAVRQSVRICLKGLHETALYRCGSEVRTGRSFMQEGIQVSGPEYLYESQKILIEMI
jgi:alpha-galactosidase